MTLPNISALESARGWTRLAAERPVVAEPCDKAVERRLREIAGVDGADTAPAFPGYLLLFGALNPPAVTLRERDVFGEPETGAGRRAPRP